MSSDSHHIVNIEDWPLTLHEFSYEKLPICNSLNHQMLKQMLSSKFIYSRESVLKLKSAEQDNKQTSHMQGGDNMHSSSSR